MRLFEGGILDKITNDEYEKMFQTIQASDEDEEKLADELGGKDDTKSDSVKAKVSSEKELTALNMRMLQGAFYLLLLGFVFASLALLLEIECRKAPRVFVASFKLALSNCCRLTAARLLRWLRDMESV
jgi:uncharacterized membrane protein